MFCTKCGKELINPGRFCTGCGAPLDAPAPMQQPQQQPVQQAAPTGTLYEGVATWNQGGFMYSSCYLVITADMVSIYKNKRTFEKNLALSDEELTAHRYARFRKIGAQQTREKE